jgi:hypothetical protein
MKYFVVTALLTVLSGAAQANDQFSLTCGAGGIQPQGLATFIGISKTVGSERVAQISIGGPLTGGNAKTELYQVTRTQSTDLSIETWTGQNFVLRVDNRNTDQQGRSRATLAAVYNEKPLALKNLICVGNEFNSHPGVSMSN